MFTPIFVFSTRRKLACRSETVLFRKQTDEFREKSILHGCKPKSRTLSLTSYRSNSIFPNVSFSLCGRHIDTNRGYNKRDVRPPIKSRLMPRLRLYNVIVLLVLLAAVGCSPQRAAQVPLPTRAVLPSNYLLEDAERVARDFLTHWQN